MIRLLTINKNFRLFWMASCISSVGDYVDDIAFSMLVYLYTKSTLITSYVFAIKLIFSFVSMFTASIVDHNNKKEIMIITSIGQGILLLILFLLYGLNYVTVPLLIIFVTVQTLFSTFSIPAQNALLPLLISDEDAIVARASSSMIQQFIQIFAYIGSGMLINFIGISGAILIDIFTFLGASILLLGVKYEEIRINENNKVPFLKTVNNGFRFIFLNKIVMIVLIVTFWGNLFASPIDSLAVVYFSVFFSDKFMYSIFMAAIAIGGIVGTWGLTKCKDKFPMNILLAVGYGFGGLGITLMLFYSCSVVPIIGGFLYGISNGFVSIMNGVLLQVNTPNEMMGRVFSAFRCVTFASGPVGIVAIGYLGEKIALNILFGILGILLLVIAFVCLKSITDSKIKRL